MDILEKLDVVWKTIKDRLPAVRLLVEEALAEMEKATRQGQLGQK
jgi:uncharacterized protein with HEPN domain